MADDILYPELDSNTNRCKNRLEVLQAFGRHADAEELLWDPVKIRRFITKAATPLFAGEPRGKKYRIALDEIGGMPKKLKKRGESLDGQPPISELIMNAALENIGEDVLLRSPKESYENLYGGGGGDYDADSSTTTRVIQDWQNTRKLEQV